MPLLLASLWTLAPLGCGAGNSGVAVFVGTTSAGGAATVTVADGTLTVAVDVVAWCNGAGGDDFLFSGSTTEAEALSFGVSHHGPTGTSGAATIEATFGDDGLAGTIRGTVDGVVYDANGAVCSAPFFLELGADRKADPRDDPQNAIDSG